MPTFAPGCSIQPAEFRRFPLSQPIKPRRSPFPCLWTVTARAAPDRADALLAMTLTVPPQLGQVSTSTCNTRLRRCAQRIAACCAAGVILAR